MSTAETFKDASITLPTSWELWRRQVGGILRLELRKTFLGRRSLLLYLLAMLPVGASAIWAIGTMALAKEQVSAASVDAVFGPIFSYFILSLVTYFGCVWIFMNLFRGEILDRSLHFCLLSAIRRDVLVAGKFLAGWASASLLFCGSTLVAYLLAFLPCGVAEASRFLWGGPGLGHLLGFLGIVLLACVGYGALFLLLGLLLKNPVLPALLILGWEFINFLLPPLLKKLSVIHYLKSLFPVVVSEGPLSVPAEPTPAWLAITGLLVFAAALLYLAGLRARRMEIEYGED